MRIDIRLYKLFDADLIAFATNGYSLKQMFEDSLMSYAHGVAYSIRYDKPLEIDLEHSYNMHLAVLIPTGDRQTCALLQGIKKRYRNAFCKAVLRNALTVQNLASYIADEALMPLQMALLKRSNALKTPSDEKVVIIKKYSYNGRREARQSSYLYEILNREG